DKNEVKDVREGETLKGWVWKVACSRFKLECLAYSQMSVLKQNPLAHKYIVMNHKKHPK
ncbi:hypothetical protein FRC02_005855, partial [Tulasnella sp. 418]